MNKKLLTGVALAAAGVAATYIARRKRSSAQTSSNNAESMASARPTKHRTDVFSNAKTASQPQAWSPARDESL